MPRANTPLVDRPRIYQSGPGNGRGVDKAREHINTSGYEGAAAISEDKPLTTLQRQFVKLWAEGHPITTAALMAGYAEGSVSLAYRLVRMPNVLALYHQEKKLYEDAAQMTRKKVMDMLLESYEMAKMMAEPASMVAATREVGKMCGYYEPIKVRHEHTVNGKVIVDRMNSMQDDELLEFMEKMKEALGPSPSAEALPAPNEDQSVEDVELKE